MSHAQHCVKSMARNEFSGFSLSKHSPFLIFLQWSFLSLDSGEWNHFCKDVSWAEIKPCGRVSEIKVSDRSGEGATPVRCGSIAANAIVSEGNIIDCFMFLWIRCPDVAQVSLGSVTKDVHYQRTIISC